MNQGHLRFQDSRLDWDSWAWQDDEFELVWVTFFYIICPHYIKSMPKIKDIMEKMKANGHEYYDLHLLIAKRVWLIIASLYYISYLFTVGGYYFWPISITQLSMFTFHLFSVLVIASVWFFYTLCEYTVAVYAPNKKWLLIAPIVIWIIFTASTLLIHLGIIR